jgi:hypothetical protein
MTVGKALGDFIPALCGFMLLAQTEGFDPTALIGSGTTIAVLAFYVVYDIRVRTPSLVAAFREEQEETRKAFTESLEKIRHTFQTEQAETRADNRAEIGEWRKMLNEQMVAFRTAVHDFRATAQVAVSKSEELVRAKTQ